LLLGFDFMTVAGEVFSRPTSSKQLKELHIRLDLPPKPEG